MGVEWYEYLATLDARTCSVCGALDGKHFRVSEAKTGVNLPPMHPNDRCTTVTHYPSEETAGTRMERNPETGKNYKVPAGTTYEQWRKEISEKYGADTLEKAQKRYANLKNDAAEQRDMQKILGKDVPSKIADFQDLKYNEPGKYADLKGVYRYLKENPESDKHYYQVDKAIRELKEKGIVNKFIGTAVKPVQMDYDSVDIHAIQQMSRRGITLEDVNRYISSARVMFKQAGGEKFAFYSDAGVSVILKDKILNTTFPSSWYDDGARAILKEVDKYVK